MIKIVLKPGAVKTLINVLFTLSLGSLIGFFIISWAFVSTEADIPTGIAIGFWVSVVIFMATLMAEDITPGWLRFILKH